jgi:medium-chain acyl-[acyl-carrier-protein] hydrolase
MLIQTAWIKCFRSNPQARLRLFCFPYAGGGASVFRSWADQLPNPVEVCAIQLPGREDRHRDALFTDLPSLIATLLPDFVACLDHPFVFFGHSLGALVCFELARQLRQQNHPMPLHLFVAGRRAPQVTDSDPPIHNLPDDRFIAELRSYKGTSEVVLQNAELMALFLPILRADFAMNETYVYTTQSPLNCPISAFGGLEDHTVSFENLKAWQAQTTASFDLQMFPGGHFFLKSASNQVLKAISQQLQQGIVL